MSVQHPVKNSMIASVPWDSKTEGPLATRDRHSKVSPVNYVYLLTLARPQWSVGAGKSTHWLSWGRAIEAVLRGLRELKKKKIAFGIAST